MNCTDFPTRCVGDDEACHALGDLMSSVIEVVTSGKDNDWSKTDEVFLGRLSPEDKTECLKEHSELKSRK